jgi:hypothetical protein
MVWLYFAVVLTLMLAGVSCMRIARWHNSESDFWHHIDLLDKLDMAPKDAPDLLAWVQTHEASMWDRLKGWKAPHERRRRWASS